MSNPGVITLTEKKLERGVSFRVEDNLGEAIHFHYKNIRVDLSVKELLEVAEICDESVRKLVPVKGFDPDDYDEDFILKHSGKLLELKAVREKKLPVKKLCYIEKNRLGIPVRKSIKQYRPSGEKDRADHIPVVFNEDRVLMYGAEEAFLAYRKDPEAKISVKSLYFEHRKYSAPKHPVLEYFFKWDRNRIIETMYAIAAKVLHL